MARLACASLVLVWFGVGCASSPPEPEVEPPAPSRRASPAPRAQPSRPPVYHTVAPGETIWRISRRYGSTVEAIKSANRIKDVTSVPVGTRLVVPNGSGGGGGRPPVDAGTYASRDPRGRSAGAPQFGWPTHGHVMSEFGLRRGAHHDGIDIKAPEGSVVRAAEAGRVIHADASLQGYGKMVIIKHAGKLSTVYAHNKKLLVSVGQFVEKGDAIALVGETGNATTPHLHFEIRSDGSPRDPLEYLR